MPGSNLTREEARDRAALLTVESYEIDLDLTTGDATFASTTTVRFRAEKGASTMDLIALPSRRSCSTERSLTRRPCSTATGSDSTACAPRTRCASSRKRPI